MKMRKPERMPFILYKLQELWEKMPDMRLGQLMEYITHDSKTDVFYLEDDKMLDLINAKLYKKTDPKPVVNEQKTIPVYKIITNKIQCNHCKDIIESTHVHDFKMCSCEAVSVDGGKSYLKRSFKNSLADFTDLSETQKIEK